MRREVILIVALYVILFTYGCINNVVQPKSEDVASQHIRSSIDQGQSIDASLMPIHTGTDPIAELQRANGHGVNALYTTQGGHRIRLSANENNGGIHGNGRITGPIYVDVQFRTACIEVVDNRATYAGEITSVELGDNPFDFPIERGWYIYFAVEDNGNGKKGRADRYHDEVYFGNPLFGGPYCSFLPPNNTNVWPESQWLEVALRNDRIQIK